MKSVVSLIAAMSENRVIGRDGALPWHLPADLRYFKKLTTGHAVVMGRKTFDTVGKPLPNRRNIVLTSNPAWSSPGVEAMHSLDEVIASVPATEELFICGGEQIYRLALPVADRIYLTRIHATLEGDAYFPEFDADRWRLTWSENHPTDDRHAYAMTFERYEVEARV